MAIRAPDGANNIQHLYFVAVWPTVQSISALFASIYYWLSGNFNETKIPGQSPLVWICWSSCLFTRQEECHKEHSGAELHYYAAQPRALLTICSALGTCIGTCALSKDCRRSDFALSTSSWSLRWENFHCTRFEQNAFVLVQMYLPPLWAVLAHPPSRCSIHPTLIRLSHGIHDEAMGTNSWKLSDTRKTESGPTQVFSRLGD